MASVDLRRSFESLAGPAVSHQATVALQGPDTESSAAAEQDRSWLATVYGLGIQSDLSLPEVMPGAVVVDVVIRLGILPPRPQERQGDVFYAHATEREAYLSWNGVGTFLVRDGREILVDPRPGVDERTLRVYLLGAVLGVVLHQRGRLITHASGVDIGGRVTGFMGTSGRGKSTIAAALHARGHALVTDDVLAFLPINEEGPPIVTPGFPSVKLFPDSLRALGKRPDGLPLVQALEDKRMQSACEGFSLRERPLGRLYVLAEGSELRIERLGPQPAFVELLRHTTPPRPKLIPVDDIPSRLRQFAELVNRVPICRLTVPRSLDRLPDVARLVEADVISST